MLPYPTHKKKEKNIGKSTMSMAEVVGGVDAGWMRNPLHFRHSSKKRSWYLCRVRNTIYSVEAVASRLRA
ncbi:hypothetical protein WOLCODRAFT_161900 [Wolfiporia cocos MD-104 SS10]|uniref:Uncharacterized protein n=1 Tax=Wolfiporia cocos (strain MD-104) TaxID=742152 RepID=A0A2H3JM06_WOLCO|nr:hypothetical protein WOLCODRAFT_161900 [Wolfiporia cocos MD-104 SS10]